MNDDVTSSIESMPVRSNTAVERDHKAFTSLLDLAEEVHARRESLRKQFFVGAGAGVMAIVASGAAIAGYSRITYIGENLSFFELFSSPLSMVFLTVIVFAYLLISLLYYQFRRQMRRETRALEEVMSVIHEVLQSSEVEMSPLEIAQVKIRLSRMDN